MKNTDIIYGRHSVEEALEAGSVAKILVAQGTKRDSLKDLLNQAQKRKIPFTWVERRKLDGLTNGLRHQGVVAYVAPLPMEEFDDLLDRVLSIKDKKPLLLFLDGIQDPQNVGSIIRSAVYFGVHGIVLPKWRAAPVTGAVVRASAGAAQHISLSQVSNLSTALQKAKKKGLWLVGADMSGKNVKASDVPSPFAVVLGSEGEGLHRLVKEQCDFLVKISGSKQKGQVDSLNVSVAAGILLQQLSSTHNI